MKKLFPVAALIALCFATMSFVVEVDNIPEELNGQPMFIKSELDNRILDSITVAGPTARLSGSLEQVEWCDLCYSFPIEGGVRTNRNTIFLGEDTVKVTILDLEFTNSRVSGGRLNEKLQELNDYERSLRPFNEVKLMELLDYIVPEIYANRDNPLGVYLTLYISRVMSPERWLNLCEALSPEVTKYPVLQGAEAGIKSLISSREGSMYKNIKGLNADGTTASLSDYIGKGKYVLVDFWATWCGPCREEAKTTLMPLYERYKDNKDFMILGVMTSDSAEAHLKGLENLNYPWPQFIDADNVATKEYGFDFIPFIMLFGPDGEILRRGIRGDQIREAVEEVIGE